MRHEVSLDHVAELLPEAKLQLTIIDSQFAPQLSSLSALAAAGVLMGPDEDGTSIRIELAANCRLAEPLHVVSYTTARMHESSELYYRVQLGKGAELTLAASYLASADSKQAYTRTVRWEFEVAAQAQATLYLQQAEGSAAEHSATIRATVAQQAAFSAYQLCTGAARSSVQYEIIQAGSAARSQLCSLLLAKEQQHSTVHTILKHQAAHGESEQYHKAVLSDTARGSFNGLIKIAQSASKTNAQLLNKNLLLTAGCEMHTCPQLEIDTDDVKCSHGATVSYLQPEELFYLQSRGIAIDHAQRLLSHAYVAEFLQRLAQPAMRQLWQRLVAQFLAEKTPSVAATVSAPSEALL